MVNGLLVVMGARCTFMIAWREAGMERRCVRLRGRRVVRSNAADRPGGGLAGGVALGGHPAEV